VYSLFFRGLLYKLGWLQVLDPPDNSFNIFPVTLINSLVLFFFFLKRVLEGWGHALSGKAPA
jgi:hypothetical protein